ncbi:MAG TPA: 30S ribosomal protein S27e [Candidatus Caldiarchaeum subterraneum]|uniref:Small ribosomal subunit protein eS27 n=1 Tax=Caldiarchaeum subterraneum TaxID=311458 RepID=A0A832ZX46_CALS0|nr:30S ribosomal protein S27e [Candidatus Caldarchaeum subterraneum]
MPETDWSRLIPKPRSKFLLVVCNECNNKQVVFDSAKIEVKCNVCGAPIAYPSGGKAIITGKIVEAYE